MTKQAPTFFLKAVVILIGSVTLVICAFVFPNVWTGAAAEWPALTPVLYPGLIGIYLTLIPFLYALYQSFRLLHLIDNNHAFSESSVSALRAIKNSAVAMTLLYVTAMPLVYGVADLDDAPGLIIFAAAYVCSPLIVATFAAILQMLVQNAIDLKTENDLTI